MPYEFYKVLHLFSIFLIFLALGGAVWQQLNKPGTKDYVGRKALFIMHGVGLVLALVAGFGLMARLNLMGAWPHWVTVKLFVWLAFGGMISLVHRVPSKAKVWMFLIPALGGFAAYLAAAKPF